MHSDRTNLVKPGVQSSHLVHFDPLTCVLGGEWRKGEKTSTFKSAMWVRTKLITRQIVPVNPHIRDILSVWILLSEPQKSPVQRRTVKQQQRETVFWRNWVTVLPVFILPGWFFCVGPQELELISTSKRQQRPGLKVQITSTSSSS